MIFQLLGISPVEDLIISSSLNNFLYISWSRPSFYSNDVPRGSSLTYHIQLVGDNISTTFNTSDTNYEFGSVTLCDNFNVSVTASVAQYSSSNVTLNHDNGSKLF